VRCFTILFFVFLIIPGKAHGQEFVYVNTDNLILRDRPEQEYMVFAILHAPCKLRVEHTDVGYNNNKAVEDKFYRVSYTFKDKKGIGHYTGGWVEKKYTVLDPSAIRLPGVDTSVQLSLDEISLIPYMGTYEDDPNEWNYRVYPYPMYKGGEHHFKTPAIRKRRYYVGSRGGCYYIGGTGKKVYVDGKYCKNVKRDRIKKTHPRK